MVERLSFAGRWHFHVLDQTRHVMDQWAFRAVARHNVNAVRASFESGVPRRQAEFAFGLFRAVTFKTNRLENRFDIALEIDRDRSRRGQLAYIHFRRAAK